MAAPLHGDRRMKVSPLNLRQLRFRTTFRGFDRAEVLALLTEVADDYEHERDLRNTMVTAQKVSKDIRANADAQAKQIVREAEMRSDLLLHKTQARLEDLQREIDGMKLKRREVENSLEASIAMLRTTLEFVRKQEQRDRDEKILRHRPR